MSTETILTLAKVLTAAGEDEEPLLEALCQAAERQWERRLRPDVILPRQSSIHIYLLNTHTPHGTLLPQSYLSRQDVRQTP